MVVHPDSHKIPRVPWYSGYSPAYIPFAYEGLTLCAVPSQTLLLKNICFMQVLYPINPKVYGLGYAPFARRYLGYLV